MKILMLNQTKEKCMTVTVKKVDTRHIAAVRHTGPYTECEPAWNTLCNWAGPKGLLNDTTAYFGLAFDCPEKTPADQLRYDACISIDTNTTADTNIAVKTIEAGDYATMTHKGSYRTLNDTYTTLFTKGLADTGREFNPNHPCVEVYLTNPKTTPENENITEIQVPLK